jgi:hypothetical protein
VALTAYLLHRYAWNPIEIGNDDESPAYSTVTTEDEISNLAFGRRCVLRFDRTSLIDDAIQTHVDLVNVTAGSLDDTWTDADFLAVEARLDTFWGAIKSLVPGAVALAEYRWYRLGPGADPPEPAVRVTPRALIAGTSGTSSLPHQVSPNISLRTAIRKRWGRMYLPPVTVTQVSTSGLIVSAAVDQIAAAANALEVGLAADDFDWIVYSPTRERGYAVSRIVVDNLFDIQRSRRLRRYTYSKTYS